MKPGVKISRRLKEWDDVEVPMDVDFFDRLHDKIMNRVEQIDMEPPLPGRGNKTVPKNPSTHQSWSERLWRRTQGASS